MITVIIPARNEVYLQKTIDNILENAEGEIEVIAVCDGYWPDPPINDHPFVNIIHHSESRGQRPSINEAARIAKGNIIGKLDAHCAVGPKFNTIIERDLEYDMTMIPEMYNLDPDTWKPKLFDDYETAVARGKVNPYMYMAMVDGHLRAQYYSGHRQRKRFLERKDIKIDETMCCMGPSFFMFKDRFWELGGCDENHGHWGQQGVEVSCKAWLSGGRLMVNKNTWFAHWFRGSYIQPNGRKGWPYPITNKVINKSRKYSDDLWLNNKWEGAKRDFSWLLKKFKPPKWEKEQMEYLTEESRLPLYEPMYNHIHRGKRDVSWKGIQVLKFPTDMTLYAEAIYETKPEIIVEIGTKFGGSALYFQDMMDLYYEGGQVITIDIMDQVAEKDPRIMYIKGSSTDIKIVKQIRDLTVGKKTMVVIDGNHNRKHVKWELHHYNNFIPTGQYLVVEDCYIDRGKYGPGEARDWFLERYRGFKKTNNCLKYLVGVTMGGWLKKI